MKAEKQRPALGSHDHAEANWKRFLSQDGISGFGEKKAQLPEKQHEVAKLKRERLAEEERWRVKEKQKAEEERRVAAAHLEQMRKNDEDRMRRVRTKRRRGGEPVLSLIHI